MADEAAPREPEDAHDLVYCADGAAYDELMKLIGKRFPAAVFEDARDFIHNDRFDVKIPGTPMKDFIKFAIREGFWKCCFRIQLMSFDAPANRELHEELLAILAEMKAEREAEGGGGGEGN